MKITALISILLISLIGKSNDTEIRLIPKYKVGDVFIMSIEESVFEIRKNQDNATNTDIKDIEIEYDSVTYDIDGFEPDYDENMMDLILSKKNKEPVITRSKVRIEILEKGSESIRVLYKYTDSDLSEFLDEFLQLPGFMKPDFELIKQSLLKELYIEIELDKEGRFVKMLDYEKTKDRVINNYAEILSEVMDKVYGSILQMLQKETEEEPVKKAKKNKEEFELWIKLNDQQKFLMLPDFTEKDMDGMLAPGAFKAFFRDLIHQTLISAVNSEESFIADYFSHIYIPFRLNGLTITDNKIVTLEPAFKSFTKLPFSVTEKLKVTQLDKYQSTSLEGTFELSETEKINWIRDIIAKNNPAIRQLLISNKVNDQLTEEELVQALISRFSSSSEASYLFLNEEGFLSKYHLDYEYTNISKFTGSVTIDITKEE